MLVNVLFWLLVVIVFNRVKLRLVQNDLMGISSGCRPDALFKLHFELSKRTFQYAYLVTTYLFSHFNLVYRIRFNFVCLKRVTGGVCVLHGYIQLGSLFS